MTASRLDLICGSWRVDFWRSKGIREATRAYELMTYPIRLAFRLVLFWIIKCLVRKMSASV